MRRPALLLCLLFIVGLACQKEHKKTYDNDGPANEFKQDVEYDYDDEAPSVPDVETSNYENDRSIGKSNKASSTNRAQGLFSKIFGRNGTMNHEFKDAHTGLVVYTSQYPSNWQVISKPTYTVDQKIPVFLYQIQGPHNLKAFNTPLSVYVAYRNPQTYQFMAQNGIPAGLQRPLISNSQIVNGEIHFRMSKSGFNYVNTIKLSNAENYIKQKINEGGGGSFQTEITTTVWENDKGQKALSMLTKAYMQQPLSFFDTMTLWLYNVDYVFVDGSNFNETVKQYENSIIGSKDNPQWKAYMEQLTQQRMQIAQQKHQLYMRNKQAAFEAHQQKMRGIWAAEDANHAAFMNRNFGAGSDIGQKQVLNMINEQETVYNPMTGKNYQVEAGSTQYWMDSDGNYIKNDDLFYTPNGDINLNSREWTKVDKSF